VKNYLNILSAIREMIICYLPGAIGCDLRYRCWKNKLGAIGKNVRIDVGVYFQNPEYIEIGDNCWIDRNVIIMAGMDNSDREKLIRENSLYPGKPGVVHIGNNVHIGVGCIVSGISAGVFISENCGIAAGSKIYAFTSHFRSVKDPSNRNFNFAILAPQENQCMIEGPVFLGKNTGVAVNCVVLPGVAIREDCSIKINSVLMSGEFPENSRIGGNPAKVTGQRYDAYSNE
jgi:acetyltransferase-like isoleucine patch superfamily enzyme